MSLFRLGVNDRYLTIAATKAVRPAAEKANVIGLERGTRSSIRNIARPNPPTTNQTPRISLRFAIGWQPTPSTDHSLKRFGFSTRISNIREFCALNFLHRKTFAFRCMKNGFSAAKMCDAARDIATDERRTIEFNQAADCSFSRCRFRAIRPEENLWSKKPDLSASPPARRLPTESSHSGTRPNSRGCCLPAVRSNCSRSATRVGFLPSDCREHSRRDRSLWSERHDVRPRASRRWRCATPAPEARIRSGASVW